MASITTCTDFGAQKNSQPLFPLFPPSICHEVMGLDAMIFVFWMLSFNLTFPVSSFTFIKRLFSSLLSAIRVVSSAYLKLLTFLPALQYVAFHIQLCNRPPVKVCVCAVRIGKAHFLPCGYLVIQYYHQLWNLSDTLFVNQVWAQVWAVTGHNWVPLVCFLSLFKVWIW